MIATDVAVVGGGPAGMAAAERAARAGARVVLLDEAPALGGQIWRGAASDRAARLARAGVTVLAGTSVIDATAGDDIALGAERDDESIVVRAKALVIATGARELFLPFPGWTLPGVVGVGGAQALLKSGMAVGGKRVVIAGTGPLLLPVAASFAAAGARIVLVAEQAPLGAVARFAAGLVTKPWMLVEAARLRAAFLRAPYRTGTWVAAALGEGRVKAVHVRSGHHVHEQNHFHALPRNEDDSAHGHDAQNASTLACDLLCVSHGLVPNTELARLLGCLTGSDGVRVDDRQATSVPQVFCAGEPTGIGGVDLAVVEGEIAGLCAVGRDAEARALHARRDGLRRGAERMARAFALRDEVRHLATDDTIVCRCEDVPLGAIDRTWTPRQAKLYTRAGMGPCQGRVCGAALSCLYGWPADAVRAPIAPARVESLGVLAEPTV